jgi:hypothetical protein
MTKPQFTAGELNVYSSPRASPMSLGRCAAPVAG